MASVNVFLRDWVMNRFDVSAREAVRMLEKKWRLPVRPRRLTTATAGGLQTTQTLSKHKTMAYRYLHRVVYHFYQRIGHKAVRAYSSYIHEEYNKGTLRRVRGTRTKYEVVFLPAEASDLLADNAFITESVSRDGLLRALAAVFSSFNVLYRYTEAGSVPGGPRVLTCQLAHFALVTMKVRQHLITRRTPPPDTVAINEAAANEAATAAAAAAAAVVAAGGGPAAEVQAAREAAEAVAAVNVDVMPALNTGHRAEWVEELPALSDLLAAQGSRASNGLRVLDGTNPLRTDTTRPSGVPIGGANPNGGTAAVGMTVAAEVDSDAPRGAPAAAGSFSGAAALPTAGSGGARNAGRNDDVGRELSDSEDDLTNEDEEEAPISRRRDSGAAARRARLIEAREEAARVAAAQVIYEEVD